MNQNQIIMNFTLPPSIEDVEVIAQGALDNLPEELIGFCESLKIQVEDMPDETTEAEQDLEDPYELIALYRNGAQLSPGVKSKVANDDDLLTIYRRPLLDMWCETCEDLNILIRQVLIEELAPHFDFSDDEIDEMTRRHFQGML